MFHIISFKVLYVLKFLLIFFLVDILMLVSAFSGSEFMRALYQRAIEEKYRFFSYGDASLLFRDRSMPWGR